MNSSPCMQIGNVEFITITLNSFIATMHPSYHVKMSFDVINYNSILSSASFVLASASFVPLCRSTLRCWATINAPRHHTTPVAAAARSISVSSTQPQLTCAGDGVIVARDLHELSEQISDLKGLTFLWNNIQRLCDTGIATDSALEVRRNTDFKKKEFIEFHQKGTVYYIPTTDF